MKWIFWAHVNSSPAQITKASFLACMLFILIFMLYALYAWASQISSITQSPHVVSCSKQAKILDFFQLVRLAAEDTSTRIQLKFVSAWNGCRLGDSHWRFRLWNHSLSRKCGCEVSWPGAPRTCWPPCRNFLIWKLWGALSIRFGCCAVCGPWISAALLLKGLDRSSSLDMMSGYHILVLQKIIFALSALLPSEYYKCPNFVMVYCHSIHSFY